MFESKISDSSQTKLFNLKNYVEILINLKFSGVNFILNIYVYVYVLGGSRLLLVWRSSTPEVLAF